MTKEEKFLDSFKQVSLLHVSCCAIVLCLCGYLLDRSMLVIGGEINPVDSARQTEGFGLEYSYLVMSIAWPIVLGVFCFAFGQLDKKRNRLLHKISQAFEEPELLAPAYFELKAVPQKLRVLVRWLPLFSLIVYVLVLVGTVALDLLDAWDGEIPVDPAVPISLIAYIAVFPPGALLVKSFSSVFE